MLDKEELQTIIKKYYSFDNPMESKFNICDNKFDLVIVSPTWKPHFVFNDEFQTEVLKQGTTASYIMRYKGKKLLFLRTGKGAPNLCDNLFLLNDIESRFIFLGSAGSLSSEIKVGDLVVPSMSISGDGASIYFDSTLDGNNMFKSVSFNERLVKRLTEILNELNAAPKTGTAYSTDTLIGEYYHLKEIIATGAVCIEQETAAFGKCMNIMGKEGCPMLVISDSLVDKINYYEPLENKKKYLETRTKILQKAITSIM